MKKFFFAAFCFTLLFAATPLLSRQNNSKLKRVAHVNPAPGTGYSEVTGCGDLAIIGAFQSSSFVWIYDLADKANPVLLSAIPIEAACLDVQVHGRYLFISFNNGMKWYDILDPRRPKLVHDFKPTPPINAHTSFVSGNTLYVADQISAGIRIFDITDKKNPQPLADFPDPGWVIHDMTVIRGRMYAAWIFGQPSGELMLADVSNPARPRELAKFRYAGAGTHNAWPTEDEQFILSTDEIGSTRHNLKIWDARTPGQLTQIAEFTPPGATANSTIHNVYVRGRYAYMSHYCEGVRIVDIANPFQPIEVAFDDFNGEAFCGDFGSNWGVDPFSNLIYASDRDEGLYVLEFADHPAANVAGKVINAATNAAIAGAMVYFFDEYPSTRTNAAGEFGIPWFKNDTVRVVTEALGYRPDTTEIITRATAPTPLTIRLNGAPFLTIAQTQLDDDKIGGSFGNGNSLIDGVETYELNFLLQNTGLGAVASGAVQLSSSDPYVKLIDTQQTVGQIGAGQTASLNGALRFSVFPIVPSEHKLSFTLIAILNGTIRQEIDFELTVQPPEIKNFRATTTNDSATLFWRPVNEAQLNGYYLYRKPADQSDTQFTRITSTPITDTTFAITGLSPNEALSVAITKVVDGVESLGGARLTVVARAGRARVLIVNGIDWAEPTYRDQMTQMYAAFPFNGGQIFDTWDVISKGIGFPSGYFIVGQTPQLTFDNIRQYEVVVWVGNNFNGDLDAWNASLPSLKNYLNNGGRLVLLTRLLYTFMQDNDFVQNYLHLSGALFLNQGPTVQQIVPLRNDLIAISALGNHTLSPGIQNLPQNGLAEPIFYLSTDPNTIMGIRVRQKTDGLYNIAVIAGRPYRYNAAALKANMNTIINGYFGLGTRVNEPQAGPENFALLPNYPNPFSPVLAGLSAAGATQIVYRLPHREKVQLKIFNVLGQRVRELLNASRESGQHTVLWDGTDDAGRRVAAGVYILHMRAGTFTAARRLTLMR